VEVGGVYQVTEKFALSSGIKFTPISWTQSKTVTTGGVDSTVTKTYDETGQLTNTNVNVGTSVEDKQTVNNTLNSMTFSLGLGATFNLTDAITLDVLAINASWTSGLNFTAFSGLVLSAKF
jgi:Na+/serine symporter